VKVRAYRFYRPLTASSNVGHFLSLELLVTHYVINQIVLRRGEVRGHDVSLLLKSINVLQYDKNTALEGRSSMVAYKNL
jgi:hypothetical protein